MYKLVVNVSGKRARIVPETHRLHTAERDFGAISQMDALSNRESLVDGIKSMLADKDITDGDLYSIELPDALVPPTENEQAQLDKQAAAADKGPVTKPKNPKKGEVGSKEEPAPSDKASGVQPSETETKTPAPKEL